MKLCELENSDLELNKINNNNNNQIYFYYIKLNSQLSAKNYMIIYVNHYSN
jgi:hypothetical protein